MSQTSEPKGKPSSKQVTFVLSEDDQCTCATHPGFDSVWFKCIYCNKWQHQGCDGVEPPNEDIEEYICPVCKAIQCKVIEEMKTKEEVESLNKE